MKNKNFLVSFMCVALLLFLASCKNPASDTAPKSVFGDIQSTSVTGIKTVYSSKIPTIGQTSKNARSATTSSIETLSYLENGKNKPLTFTTSAGKEALLAIKSIRKINNSYVGVVFDSIYEVVSKSTEGVEIVSQNYGYNNQALVNLATGAFYNFNDYSITNLIADTTTILCTDKNDKTLYKIALSNLTSADPINNGAYNPAGTILVKTNNGKVITQEAYGMQIRWSFDTNKQIMPKQVQPVLLDTSKSSFAYQNNPLSLKIGSIHSGFIDGQGVFYAYGIGTAKYYIAKLGIDNDGNTTLEDGDYNEYNLNFSVDTNELWYNKYELLENGSAIKIRYQINDTNINALFIDKNGFITVKKQAVGIQVESTAVPIDTTFYNSPQSRETSFIHNNYLYWIDGTSIKRQQLVSGSTSEVFYSNSSIVNPVKVKINYNDVDSTITLADNKLVFYKYIDAVTVGTYTIDLTDAAKTAVLTSSNTAEVKNIVTLQF